MPKQFGRYARCTLAIASLLALSFAGCRTTTSRLASIPGMGWLDRGEKSFGEGWADFEPAPELPPPSATTEPSSTGADSAVASNSEGSGTRQAYGSYGDYSKSIAGKDNASITPNYLSSDASMSQGSQTKEYNAGSNYGNYASTYGTSGPSYGASGTASAASDIAKPQQGFYGDSTASYTPPTSGGPTSTYGNFTASSGGSRYALSSESTASATSGDARYGGPADASLYTADRNSRFGGSSAETSTSQDNSWGTGSSNTGNSPTSKAYIPPGYPSSVPSGSATTSTAGRLDRLQASASANATSTSVPAVAQEYGTSSSTAPSATGGTTMVNTFADSAQQQLQSVANQAQSTVDRVQGATDGYTDATRQGIDNVTSGAANMVNEVTRFGNDAANRFGTTVQDYASDAQSRFQSATAPSIQQLGTNAGRYADALMGNSDATSSNASTNSGDVANQYVEAARENFGQPRQAVQDYASAAQDAGRNVMENFGTSIPQYPTTSTPEGYLTPSSATPATSTDMLPPASTIQRSPTPWRPGSTSDFQGSTTAPRGFQSQTSYKPSVTMTSAASPDVDDHLVLAVGDKYQFPRLLR